ncbi:MAG TPA: ComF family protein [Beijerinckiaceae bacterium]|nr:ComF family protein [Beijerinckiaceae bacterium]
MSLWEPEAPGPTGTKIAPAPRFAGFAKAIRRVGRVGLDFLYPPACLVCQTRTGVGDALCSACWGAMSFIERPFCERLGVPFGQDLGAGLLSPQAVAEPPVYERARAVARYDDGPVRQLVYRLKYADRTDLVRPLGRWMARAGAELLSGADIIIPVPLHRLRLASRRFNQAAALARVIARESGVAMESFALERVKATPPQVGLSKAQRAANMQGAFRVPDAARICVTGKRVLLVDDVLTSGSTTNAASRALLRGGAAAVDVLVFARVVTGG